VRPYGVAVRKLLGALPTATHVTLAGNARHAKKHEKKHVKGGWEREVVGVFLKTRSCAEIHRARKNFTEHGEHTRTLSRA
jgi:hypothetical protein